MTKAMTARDYIRVIPEHLRTSSGFLSMSYALIDLALFVLCGVIVANSPTLWLTIPFSLLMGIVLTGIFVVGHDCGHRSFSSNKRLGDAVGEIATGMTLWPYAIWRLSHDIHHRHTHNIERDIAWVPFSVKKYQRLGPVAQAIYFYSRTTGFFFASVFFTYYFIKDGLRGKRSRHFRPEELPAIRKSLLITALIACAYIGISFAAAGWSGFVWMFLVPQLVFQAHLSTFTLFHHTHPEHRFYAEEEWTFEKGQLGSTWHIAFPRPLEWLCHDINWHVPHHVCVGIPHYHLREAHAVLRQKFPDLVKEERFSPRLVRDVIRQCHFIADKSPGGLGWVRLGERWTADPSGSELPS